MNEGGDRQWRREMSEGGDRQWRRGADGKGQTER